MTPTILIIEDEVDLVEIYSQAMHSEGYEVYAAADGEQALGLIAQSQPAVLLLDLLLPGAVSGLEILRQVRADPARAGLTVWVVSADVERAEQARSLATQVLLKPVTYNQLRELARRDFERLAGLATRPLRPATTP